MAYLQSQGISFAANEREQSDPNSSYGWSITLTGSPDVKQQMSLTSSESDTINKQLTSRDVGVALGWLMCNRDSLNILLCPILAYHPNYPQELNLNLPALAQSEYSFFLGHVNEPETVTS